MQYVSARQRSKWRFDSLHYRYISTVMKEEGKPMVLFASRMKEQLYTNFNVFFQSKVLFVNVSRSQRTLKSNDQRTPPPVDLGIQLLLPSVLHFGQQKRKTKTKQEDDNKFGRGTCTTTSMGV